MSSFVSGLGRQLVSRARTSWVGVGLLSLASVVACTHVQAASDVKWNFGTAAPLATPSSGLPADVTGGAVLQGNNNGTTTLLTTVSVSSGYAGATGQHNAGAAARIGALNQAASGSAYFEFTLTPDAGKTLTISALQFGSRSTGTGPQAYSVFTSLDGYATAVATGATPNNSTWALRTPTLTGPVTGTSGGAITVRIFGHGGAGGAQVNTANWRIDDLQVTVSTSGGSTAPAIIATTPANGATNIAPNATISLTFNQAVNVQPGWFSISGSVTGAFSAGVTGGPTSFTLTPAPTFAAGETITVVVDRTKVTDQATGTVQPLADYVFAFAVFQPGPIVAIHAVQGPGATSPSVGQEVTVRGVVTGSFQAINGLAGFFVQEEDIDQDTNPATSEGIFVYDPSAAPVPVGSLVTVRGTVTESFGLTQLSAPVSVVVEGVAPLPTATTATLPMTALDAFERLEGMRVTFSQTLYVTEHFELGSFGEMVVSSGGILPNPTNIVAPGAPAQAQALANELNRLTVDDGLAATDPDPTPYLFGPTAEEKTLRMGDTVTGMQGVLTYKFGSYTLEPTTAPVFVRANPRTPPPARAGIVRVASSNVLNFFNGNGAGGGFPTARGANTLAEFNRQRAHIIASLVAADADVVGLVEIENDGFGSASAIQDLVNGLNAALPPGSAYTALNLGGPVGTDAITCGFIYRSSRVTPVGLPAVNLDSVFNRPPIAQTFSVAGGAAFTVCVNHFKSKSVGSATGLNADQGDGQGAWNLLRTQQATALAAWLATNPTGSADPDKLIIGDLNAYAKENPITTLLGAGYLNALEIFEGVGGYSYVFDGEVGHLDHVLTTAALFPQVVAAHTWHNNSPEPLVLDYNLEDKSAAQQAVNNGPLNDGNTPWRASDHDIVLLDLAPGLTLTGTAGRDTLTGTAGNDTITGGSGADTITGGAGADRILYTSMRDAADVVTDFIPGSDTIDLTALLASIGVAKPIAISGGHVRVINGPGGALVQIDADGTAGPGAARLLLTLTGVTAALIDPVRDLGL
jgi:predicted extracellular nuclease